jgi:Fusaric acid resistance protein family
VTRGRAFWRLLRALLRRHRVRLTLALRVTTAATLSLAIALWLGLPLPLWAVLTAVIVTQMSVGRSLKSAVDYLLGTLSGALYGGAVAILVPHSHELALLVVLAIAVAPLAVAATFYPSLAVAPITAIIVLLVPTMTQSTPLASALDRMLEVLVGGCVGFAVSFLLLPSRAHAQVGEAAARTLEQIARVLGALLSDVVEGIGTDELHRLQGIGRSLVELSTIAAEAQHERSARMTFKPDTGPLLRTLLRLRHDLVLIGRTTQLPLPEPLKSRLRSPITHVAGAAADYLSACAAALRTQRPPPPQHALASVFDCYHAELGAIREQGLTRALSAEAAERFYALGFALEQLRQNLKDLARCVTEWADASSQ